MLLVPFAPTCPGEFLGVGGRRRRRRRQGTALHPCWVGVSHGLPGTEQLCLVNGGAKPTYGKPCPASCCIQVEEPRDVLQRYPSTFSISSWGEEGGSYREQAEPGTYRTAEVQELIRFIMPSQGCVSSHPAGEETLCGAACKLHREFQGQLSKLAPTGFQ